MLKVWCLVPLNSAGSWRTRPVSMRSLMSRASWSPYCLPAVALGLTLPGRRSHAAPYKRCAVPLSVTSVISCCIRQIGPSQQ